MRNWIRHADERIGNLIVFNWVHSLAKVAAKWTDEELAEKLKKVPSKERQEAWMRAARKPYTEEERAAAAARLVAILDRMEDTMRQTRWLAGNAYSIADIARGAVRQAHRRGNRTRRDDAAAPSPGRRLVGRHPGPPGLRQGAHRGLPGRAGKDFSVVLSAAKDPVALVTRRPVSCVRKRLEVLRFAQDDRTFVSFRVCAEDQPFTMNGLALVS
jgi:hypothetical protein